MKKMSIIFLSIAIQVIMIYPFFASPVQASVWCKKPIERAIKGTTAVSFGTNAVAATLFIANQDTDAICAVDLRIYATGGVNTCSGNFTVTIYGNDANYAASGTDGPDTGNLIGTSLPVNCSTFSTDTGTFYSFYDTYRGNTNRFSFTPSADGTGTSTIATPLVNGTKYWLVVTAGSCTGCSTVNWATATTQRPSSTTGRRRRAGASVSTLTATNATDQFGSFKFYADFPTGIAFDSTYNCDALGTESSPYTTASEPDCDDTDMTRYGAGSNPCSITTNNPYSLDGPYEQITTQANYPGGAGYKGQRHWMGINVSSGTPVNTSGGLTTYFQYPGPPEMWLRAYMRYESGWTWGGLASSKTYYPGFFLHKPEAVTWKDTPTHSFGVSFGEAIDGPNSICSQNCQHGNISGVCNTLDCGTHFGIPPCDTPLCQNGLGLSIGLYAAQGNHQWNGCTGCFWKDFYPTGTSDGSWHYLEVHEKINTRCVGSPTLCDGVFDIWVDSPTGIRQIAHVTNVDYGYPWKKDNIGTILPCVGDCNPSFCNTALVGGVCNSGESPALTGISEIRLGANGGVYNNYNIPGCHYIDYDDVKVSTDGYIGPITSAIPLASGKPLNVHME